MTDTTHAEGTPAGDRRDNNPEKPAPRLGRRKMILGVAAAGVGASVVAGAEPADAATPDAGTPKVKLGKANTATATTSISMAVDGDSGISGIDTSSGGGFGVFGTSDNGYGVYGNGNSENSTGVYGISVGEFGIGVYGTCAAEYAFGVYGSAGENGYGVYGNANSGTGVYGTCAADDGYGVYGNATGDDGYGVYGNATGGDGTGVYGDSTGGYGVYGNATDESGIGVIGTAAGTGNAYGVYAYSKNSDSLYVEGSAVVTGTLSKGGGSFKIDHPVDPAGKYLYHSFVESPDMKNVYDGTVTLDDKGQATVELPDWFEALNRDYRYQLTAIRGPAPELHISREVNDGTFSIAGGAAGQKVSWQVTGIRQDAWANANRIPVEVDKKAEDQGRYLHPELFGGEAITSTARAREHTRRSRYATPT